MYVTLLNKQEGPVYVHVMSKYCQMGQREMSCGYISVYFLLCGVVVWSASLQKYYNLLSRVEL